MLDQGAREVFNCGTSKIHMVGKSDVGSGGKGSIQLFDLDNSQGWKIGCRVWGTRKGSVSGLIKFTG